MTDSPLDEIFTDYCNGFEWVEMTEPKIMNGKKVYPNGMGGYMDDTKALKKAKQAIELYCHKQVIEELRKVEALEGNPTYAMKWLKDRIAELRKTL